MITEDQLDHQLINQKEVLIRMVDSENYNTTSDALKIMKFIRPMWEQANYGYKFVELKNRAISTITTVMEDYIVKSPKNKEYVNWSILLTEFRSL